MMHEIDGYDHEKTVRSMSRTAKVVGADFMWRRGITGIAVDVALIDTGVVPVEGLTTPGRVVNGPDLSFESEYAEARYLDTFGHGTHVAGIIARRDTSIFSGEDLTHAHASAGIAPGARIVNVKVANFEGATDVSQLLAAIDWVVQNRNKHGLNIRVLNLSFGFQYRQLAPATENSASSLVGNVMSRTFTWTSFLSRGGPDLRVNPCS